MNKIGSRKARLGGGLGVNLWGNLLFTIKTESMMDIFHPDFQIKRLQEMMKRNLEASERRTPEEKLKHLQDAGIVDENGKFTRQYEVWNYIDFKNE